MQVPRGTPQRLQITAGEGAKPGGKPAPAAKENDSSGSVPVTANSANSFLGGTGAGAPAEADGEPEPLETLGQLVELKFRAPKAGKYDLTLYCISGQAPSTPKYPLPSP